jgi:hypothetical protein
MSVWATLSALSFGKWSLEDKDGRKRPQICLFASCRYRKFEGPAIDGWKSTFSAQWMPSFVQQQQQQQQQQLFLSLLDWHKQSRFRPPQKQGWQISHNLFWHELLHSTLSNTEVVS